MFVGASDFQAVSPRSPIHLHDVICGISFSVIDSSIIPSFPSSTLSHAAACAPDISFAFQLCWIYSTIVDDERYVREVHPFRLSLLCYFFGFESSRDARWLRGLGLLCWIDSILGISQETPGCDPQRLSGSRSKIGYIPIDCTTGPVRLAC